MPPDMNGLNFDFFRIQISTVILDPPAPPMLLPYNDSYPPGKMLLPYNDSYRAALVPQLDPATRPRLVGWSFTGAADITPPAVNLLNKNPTLVALGKLTATNPRATLSVE